MFIIIDIIYFYIKKLSSLGKRFKILNLRTWRKIMIFFFQHSNKTWICLDSTIEPSWAERFVSLLESPSSFFCDNGEQLFISDNVKLVFETCRLDHASPSITSKAVRLIKMLAVNFFYTSKLVNGSYRLF